MQSQDSDYVTPNKSGDKENYCQSKLMNALFAQQVIINFKDNNNKLKGNGKFAVVQEVSKFASLLCQPRVVQNSGKK